MGAITAKVKLVRPFLAATIPLYRCENVDLCGGSCPLYGPTWAFA